jgi:hypothetical protein
MVGQGEIAARHRSTIPESEAEPQTTVQVRDLEFHNRQMMTR